MPLCSIPCTCYKENYCRNWYQFIFRYRQVATFIAYETFSTWHKSRDFMHKWIRKKPFIETLCISVSVMCKCFKEFSCLENLQSETMKVTDVLLTFLCFVVAIVLRLFCLWNGLYFFSLFITLDHTHSQEQKVLPIDHFISTLRNCIVNYVKTNQYHIKS